MRRAVVVLFVFLLGLPASTLPVHAGDGSSIVTDEVVADESATPTYVVIADGVSSPDYANDVTLIDLASGLTVPLSGQGVLLDDGQIRVYLPQLPAGRFTLTWTGGRLPITINGDTIVVPVDASGSLGRLLVAVPFAVGVLLLALLRPKRVSVWVVTLTAAGIVSVAAHVTTSATPVTATPWAACEALGVDSRAEERSCKTNSLIALLQEARYEQVRELLATTTDRDCHYIAHRSSYWVWRMLRDTEQAQNMLIPGCDDGLIHGIAESMATFSSDTEFPMLLESFCSAAQETYQEEACYHGGGHAAVWRTNGNLEHAWALCEAFPVDDSADFDRRIECKGSATMEWADRWTAERKGSMRQLVPETSEPNEVCLNGPEDSFFRYLCYLGTNWRIRGAADAAQWCLDSTEFVEACFEALGENLPYFQTTTLEQPLGVEQALDHIGNCELGGSSSEACVRATLRVFVVLRRSSAEGAEVCRRTSAEATRRACLRGVEDAKLRLGIRGIELPD